MDQAEIERKLETWKRDLDNIESNIVELDGLVCYQLLSTTERSAFTGRSAEAVPAALGAMEQLWDHLHALREVVAQATRLHRNRPLFGRAQVLNEIEALLSGPSIRLSSRQVPLGERSLLSDAEAIETITPERLKVRMSTLFDRAKAVLVPLEERWARTGLQLDELRGQAAMLEAEARSLELDGLVPLRELQEQLDALERERQLDPLGFSPDRPEFLAPYFRRVRKELQRATDAREQLRSEVRALPARLGKLKDLRSRSLELHATCRATLRTPDGLDAPPRWPEPLARMLPQIETELAAGRFTSVRTELDRWQQSYSSTLASHRAVIASYEGLLARRAGLLERWQVAQRKHAQQPQLRQDRALGRFASLIVEQFAGQTDLPTVDQLIYSFETRLEELVARRP